MDAKTREYRQARQNFFTRHGSSWPGTLSDPYDILPPLALPRNEVALLMQAASDLAAIYQRTLPLLETLSDQALLEMGVPPSSLNVVRCRLPGVAGTVIGRFDFARTPAGYKLLEFNADSPGLLVETFCLNDALCREAGKVDPNEGGEQLLSVALLDAIRAGQRYVGTGEQQSNTFVTACGRYSRDTDVARYLVGVLQQHTLVGARYAAIEELCIDGSGLYDPQGRRIDVLLRVLPLHFFRDRLPWRSGLAPPIDADVEQTLFTLLETRRLAVINPPSSLLFESKALQVVIWGLFEGRLYFDDRERALIEAHMLPTYLDPPTTREPHVVKPVLGAEGDTVSLVNTELGLSTRAECTSYADQAMVYQQYVELPEMELLTELGPKVLQLVASCFVVAGRPIGVCMRAGGPITDDSAWVQPVCVAD
ncbi:MAG: glutathionylspermidine synthase family protein [Acidobacteriota bacterium]